MIVEALREEDWVREGTGEALKKPANRRLELGGSRVDERFEGHKKALPFRLFRVTGKPRRKAFGSSVLVTTFLPCAVITLLVANRSSDVSSMSSSLCTDLISLATGPVLINFTSSKFGSGISSSLKPSNTSLDRGGLLCTLSCEGDTGRKNATLTFRLSVSFSFFFKLK